MKTEFFVRVIGMQSVFMMCPFVIILGKQITLLQPLMHIR